jgi:Molecular chaperone
LKRIKEIAEASTKKTIEEAVLTVPSYFSDQQRRAVLNAGKIAGFNVLKLMNESTAAAMAYMHTSNYESKTFAVFNLGGGHFDVSIFEWNYGVLDVKAMTSRASLGGEVNY